MTGDKETGTASLKEEAAQTPDAAESPSEEVTAEKPAQDQDARPEEEATAAEEAEPSPEALKAELEEARRIAESNWDAVLRARAELDNLRKRSERDLENAHKYGLERFVSELLPVKDSLELGLAAGAEDDPKLEKLREGMELTLKMFDAALEKFGVTEVSPEGETFNPEFHQAMTMQESKEQDSNTVLSVVQKGYLLNDRLIRPALVIVAK